MPHIIVEYADQLADTPQVEAMLEAIHGTVADSGMFVASHIKTRAYPFQSFTHGGGSEPYIHVQARIKAGRDADNKKSLGEAIVRALAALDTGASVITAEVIDMDRVSYAKYTG